MKEKNDYSDIWAMLGKLSVESDLEPKEIKESMVYNLTSGRTVRLSELTVPELGTLRKGLRKALGQGSEASGRKDPSRARQRSRVLALLTRYGIDTKDWDAINAFCESPRIAGKAFAALTRDELTALAKKMHAILRKGGKRGEETASGDHPQMHVEARVDVKVSYRVYVPQNKTKSKKDKQYN